MVWSFTCDYHRPLLQSVPKHDWFYSHAYRCSNPWLWPIQKPLCSYCLEDMWQGLETVSLPHLVGRDQRSCSIFCNSRRPHNRIAQPRCPQCWHRKPINSPPYLLGNQTQFIYDPSPSGPPPDRMPAQATPRQCSYTSVAWHDTLGIPQLCNLPDMPFQPCHLVPFLSQNFPLHTSHSPKGMCIRITLGGLGLRDRIFISSQYGGHCSR